MRHGDGLLAGPHRCLNIARESKPTPVYRRPRNVSDGDADDVRFVSLEQLLRTSDVVCVLSTLNSDSAGLLNADRLRLLKKDAVLVNTARGGLIERRQDRPPRFLGQLLDEGEVLFDMAGGLSDFDEPFVAFAQHAGEVEYILVDHGVGHHRRAVIISLPGMTAKTLDRKAAQSSIESLVQEPPHRGALTLVCRADFCGIQSHHISHQRRRGHVLYAVHAFG